MTNCADEDERFMARALELAALGEGRVEPNPMVGCVLVRDGQVVGEGWHEQFGDPHAEINALTQAGPPRANGATAYVTLEPCCHQGKTPPCSKALIHARVARVVVAMEDPFPPVDGGGIDELKAAGIECLPGPFGRQARQLNAPYLKRLYTGRPWVIAKWAMSRDGRIATPPGESPWISNEASRELVHRLRGRVDAVIVGGGTARTDDPLLTARPADAAHVRRTALRVVVDSAASLSLDSRLVQSAAEAPLLVATAEDPPERAVEQLTARGVEVFQCVGDSHAERFDSLLDELGRRRMTNVLVEGGSQLLGTLFEMQAVDEAQIFVSPRTIGGELARSPVVGTSAAELARALGVSHVDEADVDGDTFYRARLTDSL